MNGSNSNSLNIEINVVDGNGTVQTLNTTTDAVTRLGVAGSKAGVDLGAIGTGAAQATAKINDLGNAGGSGFSRMTAGIKASRTELAGLGMQAGTAAQQLTAVGSAGAGMADTVGNGMKTIGGHTMTALDNVRLMRDDFGIHIPRGMEMAISRSALLSGALSAVGSAFVGLGAAEILFRIGEAAVKGYDAYISLDSAAEAYNATVEKNRKADFVNTRSIEDTTARIDEATAAAKNFEAAGEAVHDGAWKDLFSTDPAVFAQGIAAMVTARKLADSGFESKGQAATLTRKQIEDQHELNTLQIEGAHAADGALQGQAKLTAEYQKRLAINQENRRFTQEQDSSLQLKGLQSGGSAKQTAEDLIAAQNLAAQQTVLAREVRDKTIAMQNEARNAGLEGNALYRAQEQEAIGAIERSATGSAGQISAVREKFHNQEMMRLRAETDEVQKRARAEEEASLTGLAKLQAQGKDRMDEIGQKQARGGYASSADADRDRATAHAQTMREMGDEEKKFDEQVAQLVEQTSDRMISGYAKVDAERDRAQAKLVADFTALYGQLNQEDANYLAGQASLANGVAAINEQADRERAQLHARTMEQIQQVEIQADRTRQTEDRAASGAIVDEYNRRLAQAQATLYSQLNSNKLTAEEQAAVWKEYYATVQADADLAGAQMERQAQQVRDRMATSLKDLFSNPQQFLQKQAEEMFFKILANGLMGATNNLQSQAGKWLAQLLGMGPDMAAPGGGGIPGGGIIKNLTGGASGSGLQTASSSLTSAGSTLSSSGATLNSSGAQLLSAAGALQAAASTLQMNSAAGSGSGGGGGGFLSSLFGGGGGGDSSSGGGIFGGGSDASLAGLDSGGVPMSAGAAGALDLSGGGGSGVLAQAQQQSASSGSALSTAAGGASSLGKGIGIAGAAISGGIGLFNAYQNSDPLGGAISGGLAGASIGFMVGGPLGAAIGGGIGALAGAIAGLFGDNGKGKARDYDHATVAPALAAEMANFNTGQVGYTQASRDLTNILAQAKSTTDSMGSGARHYFENTISPEVMAIQAKLDQEEKGGRGKLQMSAAQFHSGGLITNFGDLGTGGTEGFIHAMMGERVMNPWASATHAPLLDAINSGHNLMPYLSGAAASFAGGGTTRLGSGGGGGSMQITLSAIDAPSFARALRTGGLGKEIEKHLSFAPNNYGGKADA